MNRKLTWAALFVPFLYVAIIIGLVFLQYSRESVFTETLGQIKLRGLVDLNTDTENQVLTSAVVEYRGLQFVFDDKHPLLIEQSHSNDLSLFLRGYRHNGNDLLIYFDRDVELYFAHDDNQMLISNKIPDSIDNPTSIRIPFTLSAGSSYNLTEDFNGVDVFNGRYHYILSLPSRSYVDFDRQLINVPEDGLRKIIRYTQRRSDNEAVTELRFLDQIEDISEEQYQREIQQYIDRAYLAWKDERYNPIQGTWLTYSGTLEFSETILINLLSEAWLRNEYTRVFSEMRTSADIHTDNLTHKSSVFLGNLRQISNDLRLEDQQINNQIKNMINQNEASVLLRPNLFQYIEERGELLADLRAFIGDIVPDQLSPLESLGLYMNYYLGSFSDELLQTMFSSFETIMNKKILPAISLTSEGPFFLTEPGISESYYSIITGLVLIEAGVQQQNEDFINLGRNMVVSVIRLSDQLGFLPAQVELLGEGIVSTLGSLPPEDVYPHITNNPHYPRYINLSDIFGPGSWGYGMFNNYEITNSPGEFTLSFVNTPSRTHYILVRETPDIDPLTGMELFDMIWRNAPDFEIYSKGRYYDPETRTLMIKFFDADILQDIKLFY